MRFARFSSDGQARTGVVQGNGIVDLSRWDPQYEDIRRALDPANQAAVAALCEHRSPDVSLEDVIWLPPIHDRSRIFCAGGTYRSHLEEVGWTVPEAPGIFLRMHESVVGSGGSIVKPVASNELDYEGELAVVIGKPGRHIAPIDAWQHVAGYTCVQDGSVRDYQRRSVSAGKNFDRSGAMGPWVVSADEITDVDALTLTTRLNGTEVQRARVGDLAYPIPDLISYVSTISALQPGDVISTGTPSGAGAWRRPPVWLQAGDVVEVEVCEIGVLRVDVVSE
jgi:2-keto-4-pentenoate hydratase/2-oxohepta-3-ene-1,7-dioic acid hydratase in catechol pathway